MRFLEKMLEMIFAQFPYELSEDQKKVIEDVVNDFRSPFPMMRMIQADVGCGKTAIAFISAMIVNLNARQAALMCPTETLARQHYRNAYPLFKKLGLKCALLLGGSSKKKRETLEMISSGEAAFVIGTHSLFHRGPKFKNLAPFFDR